MTAHLRHVRARALPSRVSHYGASEPAPSNGESEEVAPIYRGQQVMWRSAMPPPSSSAVPIRDAHRLRETNRNGAYNRRARVESGRSTPRLGERINLIV
ncbi:MAG: hypothetical protein AAFR21_09640 [Pseudomonadota bacterium]